MSTLEVNTIAPITGSSDVTLGGSSKNVKFASGTTVDFNTNTPTITLSSNLKATPSFHAYRSDAWNSVPNNAWAKIPINVEEWDTDSAYDHSTNYRFTPQVAGKYYIYVSCNNGTSLTSQYCAIYKNGGESALAQADASAGSIIHVARIVELNGSSDYVEPYVYMQGTAAADMHQFRTFFGGYRLVGA
tara:strand:+ start:18 stop:581 length:564 start_codon:yes stop_codon:yes gene_type:complete